MPRLMVHGFTISLVPHRFLVSMAVLVCGTLAQAQIDSAYLLTVDRRVQATNAEKDHEPRTLENDEFLEYTTDGGGELKGYVKNGELVKMVVGRAFQLCHHHRVPLRSFPPGLRSGARA